MDLILYHWMKPPAKKNLPLVEKLVQEGANCCVASSNGEPIIHKALRKGLISGKFS